MNVQLPIAMLPRKILIALCKEQGTELERLQEEVSTLQRIIYHDTAEIARYDQVVCALEDVKTLNKDLTRRLKAARLRLFTFEL